MTQRLPPARLLPQGVSLYVREPRAVQALLAGQAPGDWFASAIRQLKHSDKIDARLLRGDDGQVWFVKQYAPRGWVYRLLAALGQQRGVHIMKLSLELEALGVPVPAPAAALTQADSGGARSWFVCQAVVPARNLREAWETDRWQSLGGPQPVFEQVATLFARLHNGGFIHGDMKWPNLLVTPGGELLLTDLDGMSRPPRARSYRYGRDLARFILNAREFGVPRQDIDQLLVRYGALRDIPVEAVRHALGAPYRKLERRHQRKYGSHLS